MTTLVTVTALDPLDQAPEELWSHAVRSGELYRAVSLERAEARDGWCALHAQLHSDLSAVILETLQYHGSSGAHPRHRLNEVEVGLAQAWEPLLARAAIAPSASITLQQLRDVTLAAFNAQTAQRLAATWGDLAHLDGLAPTRRDPAGGFARFGGQPPHHYRRRLAATIHTEAHTALKLEFAGRRHDGVLAAYRGELAAYELYLLEAARVVEDTQLVTVDVRWHGAAYRLQQAPPLPDKVTPAVTAVRAVLSELLGPVEAPRLAAFQHDYTADEIKVPRRRR